MAEISLKQFDGALETIGVREHPLEARKKMGRAARVMSWLRAEPDMTDVVHDIFDATAVRKVEMGMGITSHRRTATEVVSRWFVPVEHRAQAIDGLVEAGVAAPDIYTQAGEAGNNWYRVNAGGDPVEFRSLFTMRKLLDEAPDEGGIVDVPASDLNLAVNGEPLTDPDESI